MSRTLQDYLLLCRRFQEQNEFEFIERDIVSPDQGRGYYIYNATYRDDGNYKTNVEIRYNGREISWEIEEGWKDAHDEIEYLYSRLDFDNS